MKIPLFDLDETLIKKSNYVHRQSFVFAIKKVFDIDIPDVGQYLSQMHGMIDSQILIELLQGEIEFLKLLPDQRRHP